MLKRNPLCLARAKRSNSNGGFTLVEVVISLTIVAMVMAIIFSLLKLSYSSAEKGERVIAENQYNRISRVSVARQLASYYPYPIKGGEGGYVDSPFFLGFSNRLLFTTSYSVTFGSSAGIVFTEYNIRQEKDGERTLMAKETLITDYGIFSAFYNNDEVKIKEIMEKSAGEEISVMKFENDIEFRYFDKLKKEWKAQWDCRSPALSAPAAIGIFTKKSIMDRNFDNPVILIPVRADSINFKEI